MRRRGFTMLELAIVVTLMGILVPLIFMFFRIGAADYSRAQATLDAARELRELGEELRLDGRNGRLAATGVAFEGEGACFPVTYRLQGAALVREAPAACGGARGLVRNVASMERTGALLTVRVAQLPEDLPITLVVPLGGAR
jgi:prepilin-type N-terminal cleavage/methylation domain-containing protein